MDLILLIWYFSKARNLQITHFEYIITDMYVYSYVSVDDCYGREFLVIFLWRTYYILLN